MATYKIELKVGPLENKDCNSLIVKTIEDKYEGEQVTEKSMELILYGIDNNFVGTKSKAITFNGLLWRVEALKGFENKKDYFTVGMFCKSEQASADWSYELSGRLKLMSVNADSAPVEKCFDCNIDKDKEYFTMNLVKWSKLEKRFIKHKTIQMVLKMKVKKHQ